MTSDPAYILRYTMQLALQFLRKKLQGHATRESSVDSNGSEQDCNLVSGANPNPTTRMVPECLTGRPTESQELLQRQKLTHNESQDTVLPFPETTSLTALLTPLTVLLTFWLV